MNHAFIVKAPMNGWLIPITEIPDPVFAQGLAGDGVAINPTGSTLCAPFDGLIVSSPKTPHAISIRHESGAEFLMHIGIDTVLLKGKGFKVLVVDGESVKSGQTLIDFDLEYIVNYAASAITPVLFTNSNGKILKGHTNKEVCIGDILFEVETQDKIEAPNALESIKQDIVINIEQGLHARPAAQLAALLRSFKVNVNINFDNKIANASSMVSVMSLGIKRGDTIVIEVSGDEKEIVLSKLLTFFEYETSQLQQKATTSNTLAEFPEDGIFKAVIASRGLATGFAYQIVSNKYDFEKQGKDKAQEIESFEHAIRKVNSHINQQIQMNKADKHGILEAHAELIRDPALSQTSRELINDGFSAGYAWQHAISNAVKRFNATDNAYMRARVADLLDIEQQVSKVLSGQDLLEKKTLPSNSILITDELLPSELLSFDCRQIAGICSSGGGPSAHVAIIAASMDIPFLVATGSNILQIKNSSHLILDAEKGFLHFNAGKQDIESYEQKITQLKNEKIKDLESAHLTAHTQDNQAISVFCNLGDISDVPTALTHGAEGCGLLRTEFMFLDRQNAPPEEEQLQAYSDFLIQMPEKPLTIRTMDIGGDKPIPYLSLPEEENPALGLRGIRTSFWNEQLFAEQIRAILRLPQPNLVRILLPMINDVVEVELAKKHIMQYANDLGIKQIPPLGIMVETPSAAILADQLLAVVDFISIGSNDLSQYVLAIDRGHPELASKLDALHPSVLRTIHHVANAAKLANKKVSLCGGLASDPTAIPILIGLGVYELSMVPAVIPRVKNLIRSLSLTTCQKLAAQSINELDAASVRNLVDKYIDKNKNGAQL